MGAGRFVGRVGGLAVAMGVGTAVSFGHGVAWAEDAADSGDSSQAAHSRPDAKTDDSRSTNTATVKGEQSTGADVDSGESDNSSADTDRDVDTDTDVDTETADDEDRPEEADTADSKPARAVGDEVAAKRPASSRKRQVAKDDESTKTEQKKTPKAANRADDTAARAANPETVADPASVPAAVREVLTAPKVMLSPTPAPDPTPPPPVRAEAVTVTSVATALTTLFGGHGGLPTDSPLAWVVAAAARRELGAAEPQTAKAMAPAVPAVAANKPPVIGTVKVGQPDAATGVVTGSVAATDADKNTLTWTAPATTTKGAVVVNSKTGAFTYTPTAAARHAAASTTAAAASKTDSFTVTVTDGKGGTATKLISVVIAPKNLAPTGGKATVGSPNPTTGVVTGTVTATDADKDRLTYTGPGKTAKGTISLNTTTGTFTYTPTAAARLAAGSATASAADKKDTFTVAVADGFGGSASVAVTVVIAPNRAPTGGKATVTKTDPATGVVTGTLSATDADKDPVTFTGPTKTAKGALVVSGTTFTYTPTAAARHAAAKTGAGAADKQDTFTVTASDGKGGIQTFTVNVTVTGKNTAPTGAKATVGSPNTSTGVVSGTVTATDPDKDKLTYTTPAKTAKGAVTLNATTGAFTYTPTAAARQAAAKSTAAAADKKDTFTVTVSDGFGGTTQLAVSVVVSPDTSKNSGRNVVADGSVSLPGRDGYSVISADGTRAVIATVSDDGSGGYTTHIGVINVITKKQVGKTLNVVGDVQRLELLGSGRAVVTTEGTDSAGFATSRAVLVDSVAGTQVGSALTLAGSSQYGTVDVYGDGRHLSDDYWGGIQVSADGTRIVMVTSQVNADSSTTTRLAVMNSSTGAKVGSTQSFTGSRSFVNSAADGARLVVTTAVATSAGERSTRIAVINASTGKQLGSTVTVPGDADDLDDGDTPTPAVQFSADGTRAAVTTLVSGASPSSRIAVLNLTNGAQLGTTLTENAAATTELSADGTRLAIATVTQDGTTHKYSTTLKLVNTATGAIVGAPATVTGVDRQTPQFTADGSRAIFTVFPVNSDGRFTAVTVHTFNAATGARVGSAVTVSGVPNGLNSVELSPNGQRAVISAITGDSSSGPTTNYVVLNTATGTKVGATISVAGVAAEFENGAEFSSDGTRAYVDTLAVSGSGAETTRFAVIDLVAGAQVGKTLSLAGNSHGWEEYSDDGARVLITADVWSGAEATRVALVDAKTGAQVGATSVFTGDDVWAVYRRSASRVLVMSTVGDDISGSVTTATILDAMTGAKVGTPQTVVGDVKWTIGLDRAATVLAATNRMATGSNMVRLLSLNTSGSTQTGNQVTVDGYLTGLDFSNDLSRGIVVSVTGDEATGFRTTVTTLTLSVPIVAETTVKQPNSATGVVTGTVTAIGGGMGGAVTYTASTTDKGAVSINKTTGAFTFTPTAAARKEVLAPGAPTTATFTVVVKDTGGGFSEVPVTVTIAPGTNAAPTGVKTSSASPNPVSGVVTGTITAIDPDGDPLTFRGPVSTPKGTLVVNSATGAFIYTPTSAARARAAATDAPASDKKDTFTIAVDDGYGGTAAVSVTVTIAPAAVTPPPTSVAVVKSITIGGQPYKGVFSSDGRRAMVFSSQAAPQGAGNVHAFTVIDTATGAVIGKPVNVIGDNPNVVFSAVGDRAVVSTSSTASLRVAVIDTIKGAQVGATRTFASSSYDLPVLNTSGSRALVTATSYEAGTQSARVGLIDTATGTLVYDSGPVAGARIAYFSADGTRVAVSTVQGPLGSMQMADYVGSVQVINANTGAQIGKTLTRNGWAMGALNADGTRLLLQHVTGDMSAQAYSTQITVVNTTTGNALGGPIRITGASPTSPVFTADGSRAVLTAIDMTSAASGGSGSSTVLVVDLTSGAQVGKAVTVTGTPTVGGVGMTPAGAQMDATGTRAVLLTTSTSSSGTYTTAVTVVSAVTGTKLGTKVLVTGSASGLQLSADGTRALISTKDPSTSTTRLSVVDLTKGAQVGSVRTVGTNVLAQAMTADGTRIVVASGDGISGKVTVYDAATGAVIGTPLSYTGRLVGAPALSGDGSRAVISVAQFSDAAQTKAVTKVIVLNTSTATQAGKTVTIDGSGYFPAEITQDGTRALVSVLVSATSGNATLLKIT